MAIHWYKAAEYAREWARAIRRASKGDSEVLRTVANWRAEACEDLAEAMELNGREDVTPNQGTHIPPEADRTPEPEPT